MKKIMALIVLVGQLALCSGNKVEDSKKKEDNTTLKWSDNEMITQFYVGYEGGTVDSLTSKQGLRTSLFIYSSVEKKFDMFGSIVYSASAENADSKASPYLEADINIFRPFSFDNDFRYGLIVNSSIGKDGNSTTFSKKFNIGFRLANSPENFFDVFYSRVKDLSSNARMEIRGQLSFGKSVLGGHFVLGGVANFDLDNKSQNDTAKLYIMWSKDLKDIDIFKGFR